MSCTKCRQHHRNAKDQLLEQPWLESDGTLPRKVLSLLSDFVFRRDMGNIVSDGQTDRVLVTSVLLLYRLRPMQNARCSVVYFLQFSGREKLKVLIRIVRLVHV